MFLIWIVKNKYGFCNELSSKDLVLLKDVNVSGLLSIDDEPEGEDFSTLLNINYLHLPIKEITDINNSILISIKEYFQNIRNLINKKQPILVMGKGRETLSCFLALLFYAFEQRSINIAPKIAEINLIYPEVLQENKETFMKLLEKHSNVIKDGE